jgi:hypothetical protein
LRCGGDHLHRECPEKTNAESTPRCCNYTLTEGENPHSASYRGCSHAKGELQRRNAPEGSSGRMISSELNSPEQSYTSAFRQDT